MKKKMLLLAAGLIVVGLCSSAALALGPMGPPMAGLTQGQFSAGVEYGYSETDVELSESGMSETLEGVKTNIFVANLGYGFTDKIEGFIRLGGAQADVKDSDFDIDFNGDMQFAFGLGAKATLAQDGDLTWGTLFQIGWIQTEDEFEPDVTGEIDTYEILIAAGPTYKMEGWSLYGGPFLQYINGDFDVKYPGGKDSIDVEEESEFGGYIGAQVDIAENTLLNVEYQITGDAWAIGTGIVWKF